MRSAFQKSLNNKFTFMLFVLPILLPFIIFFIIPLVMGIYYSCTDWNGISNSMCWIGFKNYLNLFSNDADYFTSLNFTFKYVLLTVLGTNLFAILLALALSRRLAGKNILRACFFLPNVIGAIIIGFLWRFIFTQVSDNLYSLTGWGFFKTSWLGNPKVTLFSMALVALWQSVGYTMVIYLAGLQSIDESYHEAASLDGASAWQKFVHITLPLIMPAITVNLFMTISQAFRLFDLNYTLTDGGPGRMTMGLALDIYKEAFQNNQMGYGSAKAVILFIIALTVTLIQVIITKRKEVEV